MLTLAHDASSQFPERVSLITSDDIIIGHVPLYFCKWVYRFLKKESNKGKAIVLDKPINRGAGLGLEIPVTYIFSADDTFSINWIEKKLSAEHKYLL